MLLSGQKKALSSSFEKDVQASNFKASFQRLRRCWERFNCIRKWKLTKDGWERNLERLEGLRQSTQVQSCEKKLNIIRVQFENIYKSSHHLTASQTLQNK